MTMKTRLLILIFAAVSLLSACRSQRAITDDTDITPDNGDIKRPPVSAVDTRSAAAQYTRLCATYHNWDAIEAPVKVNITSPSKMSVSGKLYMARGKDVYISLRMLGLEVANLYVTADSVFASEKLGKHYVAESLTSLLGGTNLTVNDIQDMLLGRAFVPGKGTVSDAVASLFDITLSGNRMLITPRQQPAKYEYGFMADTRSNALTTIVVEPAGHTAVECNYAGATTIPGVGGVCSQMSIDTTVKTTHIAASLEIKYDEAKTGKSINSARWKQPKGYVKWLPINFAKSLGQ